MKLTAAASIVAILSIHLLRTFMYADGNPNDKILWYVVLHLTFVVSAVLLAVLTVSLSPRTATPDPHRPRRS